MAKRIVKPRCVIFKRTESEKNMWKMNKEMRNYKEELEEMKEEIKRLKENKWSKKKSS